MFTLSSGTTLSTQKIPQRSYVYTGFFLLIIYSESIKIVVFVCIKSLFFLELCCAYYINGMDFDRYSLELRPGNAGLPLFYSGKE